MNLPNKLTLSRLLAVVVICLLYFIFKNETWVLFTIMGLFILASFTDFLDGYIARKNNIVTGFGKLMDPLADKLLVITSIILLIDYGVVNYPWMLVIIIARELFVLGIRLIALEEGGGAIAADIYGKIKTFTQMVSLSVLFFYAGMITIYKTQEITIPMFNFLNVIYYIGIVLFYISVALTVLSGIEVFLKNKKYFKIK